MIEIKIHGKHRNFSLITAVLFLYIIITIGACGGGAANTPNATTIGAGDGAAVNPTTAATTAAAENTTASSTQAAAAAVTQAADSSAAEFSYPMPPTTLTINHSGWDPNDVPDWAMPYWYVPLTAEITGVTLKAVYNEAVGTGAGNLEPFFLMLASGDLPDLIQNNWLGYPGGPEAALSQNLIIPLNDVFDQYSPNILKAFVQDPQLKKDIMTDSGIFYNYPLIRNSIDQNFYGMGYRQDKLDELGLSMPTTPEELEDVLRAFKDAGMPTGLTFEYRFMFMGDQGYGTALHSGFGIKSGFWVEDGKVHYGEAEPAYEDFLIWMHRLYSEGLIDPDMPSVDKVTSLAKFTSGEAWVSINMDANVTATLANFDPSFIGAGGPSLTTVAGVRPKFGHLQNKYPGLASISISTACKNIEAAARYLDWYMSPEGSLFAMHGVEGFAYTFVDGKITDDMQYLIKIDDPDAQDITNRNTYKAVISNWPMLKRDEWAIILDARSYNVYDAWLANDMPKHIIPPVNLTEAESKEYASLIVDLETFIKEQVAMFIIGIKDLSDYQTFRATLNTLGVDRVIELQQAAYDRYLLR